MSSGIDIRDIRWSFACQFCGHDNEDVDAYAERKDVWTKCELCGEMNEGRLDND